MNTAFGTFGKPAGTIKHFPVLESLRTELFDRGVRSMTDQELLVLLIRHGDANHRVMDIAQTVLDHREAGLQGLAQHSALELAALPGMNRNKAAALVAALELGRRRSGADPKFREQVSCSSAAYELLKPVFLDLPHEEFWLLLLDRGQRLVSRTQVSSGGLHGTVADPKLIYRSALERRASSIILAHNHPSGQLRPSEEDIRLTKKLVEAGKFLDIQVSDHLILADTGYYSFSDNGQLS